MIYKPELIQLGLNNMLYISAIGYVDRFKYPGPCTFTIDSRKEKQESITSHLYLTYSGIGRHMLFKHDDAMCQVNKIIVKD